MASSLLSLPDFGTSTELLTWLRSEGPVNPSVAVANALVQRLRTLSRSVEELESVSMFVLRTATVEPLRGFLEYHLYRNGFQPSVSFSGYADWRTLASDPSSDLYADKPNLIVIWLRLEELSPQLSVGFSGLTNDQIGIEEERVLTEIADTVKSLRTNTQAPVLISNLPLISMPALGLLDSKTDHGQNRSIERLNGGIRHICTQYPSVHVFDFFLWSATVGLEGSCDRRQWHAVQAPLSSKVLNSLALEYVRYIWPLFHVRKKCLVVDLDNTLWGGILGEDGLDGIKIGGDYPGNAFLEFQQVLLSLYHRGVLLAICSKNNEPEVRQVLERHPDMVLKVEHFASIQINWDEKSNNLKRIAEELNIGLDSLVFVDDSPVEGALIRQLLPEVSVLELPANPSCYADALRRAVQFETFSLSNEDRMRGDMYRAQVERKRVQESASSIEEYYVSLEMCVEIGRADSFSIPRIAQLTQKTNQFNLTTRRYSESEIKALTARFDYEVYCLRLKDRFGDSGITGVAILRYLDTTSCEIDTFLLSCRVLGRTVETAFLSFLITEARKRNAVCMKGCYIPTSRNIPAQDFYAKHGFLNVAKMDGEQLWEADIQQHFWDMPRWFKIEYADGGKGRDGN